MKPEVDRTLQLLAETLLLEIAPGIQEDYRQRNVQLMAMLLSGAVEEWDRAAERRVEENRAIRRILRKGLKAVTDDALRARLDEAAKQRPGSVRIQNLNRDNDALRALLIELQAHVEELDTPEAKRTDREIWRELRASTERRQLSMAPF